MILLSSYVDGVLFSESHFKEGLPALVPDAFATEGKVWRRVRKRCVCFPVEVPK